MESSTTALPLVHGYSHFGMAKNRYYEDRLRVEQRILTKGGLSFTLGMVADGIGGQNAGERAAALTVDEVFEYCKSSNETDIPRILKDALESANKKVYEEAQIQRAKKNMGATAAVAIIYNNNLYIANVGDSRIYLIRNNQITQLTVDHTWEREMVETGKLSEAEALRHPRRGELVRSIGYEPNLKVDLEFYIQSSGVEYTDAVNAQGLSLLPGDRIIICSDGLVKSVPNGNGHFVETSEIVKIVNQAAFDKAPEKLVQMALRRNVDDNVSVIVMEIPGGKRTFTYTIQQSRFILSSLVAILAVGLFSLMLFINLSNANTTNTPLPPLAGDQISVAQIQNLELSVILANTNVSQFIQKDSFITFKKDVTINASGNHNEGSYAYLGFPGGAQLFLAGSTSIVLEKVDQSNFEILLEQGWVLINKPGRNFIVDAPNGSKAWVSGSMMGLWYNSDQGKLYMDCLQDKCWIGSNDQHPLPAGWHAVLLGPQNFTSGSGTHNEYWQFVPGIVFTPTPIPSNTPTLTPVLFTPTTKPQHQPKATPLPKCIPTKKHPCPKL